MMALYKDTARDEFYSTLLNRINHDACLTDDTPSAQVINNEIWVDRTVCACTVNQIWILALAFNTAIQSMEKIWKTDTEHDYSDLQKKVCDTIIMYMSGNSSHDTFSDEISLYSKQVKKKGHVKYGIQGDSFSNTKDRNWDTSSRSLNILNNSNSGPN
jgi:hypothetical protein